MHRRGYERENMYLCAAIDSLRKKKKNLNICCPPAAVPSLSFSPRPRFNHLAAAHRVDQSRQMGWGLLVAPLYA